MKKLLIIALIFTIMGGIFLRSPATAQDEKSPHENPESVTGVFNEVSLLLTYSRIFYLASISDYDGAQAVLDEFGEIELPEEIRYITARYNEISQELFTILDNLEIILDETSDLIKVNQIDKARQNLDAASIQAKQAELLLDDLSSTMDVLSERLGIFLTEESSDIQQAYSRLEDSLELIKQLLNNLAGLRLDLAERCIAAMELQSTQLSLEVNTNSVYIGGSVTISGLLSNKTTPLAGKKISVSLDGNPIEEVITGEDGRYKCDITIPYKYVNSMTVFTRYEPQDEDFQIYQASQSPEFEITTLFYNTDINISAPAIVYPGIPFDLSGEIINEGNNIPRIVRVSAGKTSLAEFEATGVFSFAISLPEEIELGTQKITVIVEPREKYAGITENIEINVALIPITIEMEIPGYIILPGLVELSGNVYHEQGPSTTVNISLSINDKSVIIPASPDGSFTAKLYLPLDISFIGQRNLLIDAEPLEPWASDIHMKRQIMIINPVGSLLVLLAALALAVFISRRWWRTVRKDVTDGVTIKPEQAETPEFLAQPVKITGVTGRIIAAYRAFLTLTERACGIRLTPPMTLREFLSSVTKLLPGITRPLAALTDMMERALYSNQKPSRETAVTAEQLSVNIKEELGHEAS